jgi:NitT/TauT family transport system permease protein
MVTSRRIKIWLVWLAALAAWEVAYRTIHWRSWIFPAPSHVLDATIGMLGARTHFGDSVGQGWPWHEPGRAADASQAKSPPAILPKAVLISGVRLIVGFVISLALGMMLGLATWRSEFLDQLLGPVFLGLQTLPSVCWVPLAILTLGLNETAILMVLVLGSCFAIALSLRDGLRTIPPIFHRAGLMLGARKWRLYRYVLLPASLPALASSLRQGFSFAWRSLMGAELIFMLQNRGLGFLLSIGRDFGDVAQVVAVMIMMILIGMAADRWVFAQIERRVRRRFGLIVSP